MNDAQRTEFLRRMGELLASCDNGDEALGLVAVATATFCSAYPQSDRMVLKTIDSLLHAFRLASNEKYRNQDPSVS